jgi:murein DD-endopeptidase MepM/ murein hydrolase activator NlpD
MPPRTPARARPRRLLAALIAAVVLVAVPLGALAEDQLQEARQELRETKDRIRARAAKMRQLQREMNRIATRIAETESEIDRAEVRMAKLHARIGVLQERHARLQEMLDTRTREAYILGPGAPIMYLLTATSTEDMVNRIGFLDEMNRRDGLLAARVAQAETQLAEVRWDVQRTGLFLQVAKERMAADRVRLREKMAQSRKLFAELKEHKEVVLAEISRIRPFAVCPVRGPHAISDSFGIWVQRSKERGGDHIHQGNDIMAAMGTPIVAPFDGLAVTANNRLGGLAVKVFGKYGYVYNAHLSSFGKLGQVQTGDVIGYVGATGNAGGPHNHFEWHPGNGPAADPYPFLMLVC